MIGAASSEAQSPVKQVLILQSLDRGNLVLDQFTGEFRVNLDQRVARPVNVVQVVVAKEGLSPRPSKPSSSTSDPCTPIGRLQTSS